MNSSFRFLQSLLLLSGLVFISSCRVFESLKKETPRERYGRQLKEAELDKTVAGSNWFAAGEKALSQPLSISLPYTEKGFFPASEPRAYGYRFELKEGQQVQIKLSKQSVSPAAVFVELHTVSGNSPNLLAHSDSSGKLEYKAEETNHLVLRLSCELLVNVSYTLTLTTEPSLAFPVSGGQNRDIGSLWGAPRDAGARSHEGIDVFGKRGTPVLAVADGRISSVANGGLGGKTVWLRTSGSGLSIYYAHLDSQLVSLGQKVRVGDTVGLMGNTGNARTTAPHLHFGIYKAGGAVNPLPYVEYSQQKTPKVTAGMEMVGKPARVKRKARLVFLDATKTRYTTLSENSYLLITAVTEGYYKVLAPDGIEGFLPLNAVSGIASSIKSFSSKDTLQLYAEPNGQSAVRYRFHNKQVEAKAVHGDFLFAKVDSMEGWLNYKPEN